MSRDAIAGVLLGTAVGDAVGLPREGLSPRRARRLLGGSPLRHRFFFGRGMISDDAEHTCMTAQALIASGGDPVRFRQSLAWRLRGWLLGLPAGIGLATLRSILKLWIGFPPDRSGVWSAGNGPAMRAAIIGAYCAAGDHDITRLREFVRASTRLTHTEPAAEEAAVAVALAAWHGTQGSTHASTPTDLLNLLREQISDPTLLNALAFVQESLTRGEDVSTFAHKLGLRKGVSGYINHTVPVALFCAMRHSDNFRTAVEVAILLGGDADTVGAITGGIMGAQLGDQSIPREWLDGILESPRSVDWMRELSARLQMAARGSNAEPLALFWPAILIRNLFFLIIVLLHGLRRLLPPY